jgi:hypothetical protein
MRDPVLNKADMNRRLVAGEFGNTNPQWRDVTAWAKDPTTQRFSHWGVRHTTLPAFAGTRLNVPTGEVAELVARAFGGRDYNVSPMIWCVGNVQWEGGRVRPPGAGPDLLRHGRARTWILATTHACPTVVGGLGCSGAAACCVEPEQLR